MGNPADYHCRIFFELDFRGKNERLISMLNK